MSSTFGSITTVRLGIYSAQKGLDVTGNNITNINTTGYTRQRLDQISLVTTSADKTGSQYNSKIGQGAIIKGVNQLRDPGLDLSYRNARTDTASADQKLAGLELLANILDEVGKGDDDQDDGVILNQMNDLRDLINQALTNGITDYEGAIRSSAEILVSSFNQYAGQLSDLEQTLKGELEADVKRVNQILTELRDLNQTIRDADIRGDAALELRDTRNILLDELSGYMKINVTYSDEEVAPGFKVEKMTVSLATGNKEVLLNGIYGTQLSRDDNYDITVEGILVTNPNYDLQKPIGSDNYPFCVPNQNADFTKPNDDTNPWYLKTNKDADFTKPNAPGNEYYLDAGGNKTTNSEDAATTKDPTLAGIGNAEYAKRDTKLGDTDLHGSLQALRELLTEKGEYNTTAAQDKDPNAAVKRGVPYYQAVLDNLARTFAEAMNEINAKDNNPNLNGGPLFSNSGNGDDVANITAANISVSKGWADGTVKMIAQNKDPNSPNVPSDDRTNLANFLNVFSQKHGFYTSTVGMDSYTIGTPNKLLAKNPNYNLQKPIGSGNYPYLAANPNANFNADNSATNPWYVDKNNTPTADPTMAEEVPPSYSGSFEDMLLRMESILGEDMMATTSILNNYAITEQSYATSRESFSGVDLNDEATSLMIYQKAYTAACRVMTVLDEVLDTLLNTAM